MGINQNSVYYRCLLLGSSSVTLEVIGFFYRILLGRMAGAQAMGLHSLVMSAYNILLSCTLTGISLSIPRITSAYIARGKGRAVKKLIDWAVILFLGFFALMSLPFLRWNRQIAGNILGNIHTQKALMLILPCLFLTGFENIHKAYFYGTEQVMIPAFSEILEMLCRAAGVSLCFSLWGNVYPNQEISPENAAALIVFCMILSEFVSASLMTIKFHQYSKNLSGRADIPSEEIVQDIASIALPAALSTLLVRLISSASMVLLPRILVASGCGYEEAMEKFGTLSGMTMPMLYLPSALISPMITVLSPQLAAEKELGQHSLIRRKTGKAVHMVGIIGFPSMVLMLGAGKELGQLLYHNEKVAENLLILCLITLEGFYYAVCESILESLGRQKQCSMLAVLISAAELGLTLWLGGQKKMGMKGFLLGQILGQTAGMLISVFWLKKSTGLSFRLRNWVIKPCLCSAVSGVLLKMLLKQCARWKTAPLLGMMFSAGSFVLVYIILLGFAGTDFWAYTDRTLFSDRN